MIVQISPRVSLGLPSTMSSGRMFTNLIWRRIKKEKENETLKMALKSGNQVTKNQKN